MYSIRRAHLLFIVSVGMLVRAEACGWTQDGGIAPIHLGVGVFLRETKPYTLITPETQDVSAETLFRWKEELRRTQAEMRELQASKLAVKNAKAEEIKKQSIKRERQLRENPTAADIENGQALNALLYDLTDPAIKSESWKANPVRLPDGITVKQLVFRFIAPNSPSNSSRALSRGVVALSRLSVAGNQWPVYLKQEQLNAERAAFETAYSQLRDQLIEDRFQLESLQQLDRTLEALKAKIQNVVPVDRGFRVEAVKFVNDLSDASRIFDASTVEYSREILIDTKDRDATSVGELVSFMLKYRLQFASAERNSASRHQFTALHEAFKKQWSDFGLTSPDSDGAAVKWVSLFNGQDLSGWKLHPDNRGKWEVENGEIVGSGPHRSYLFTQRNDYTDFHLRLEIKINQNGSGGVCFRTLFFNNSIMKGNGYKVSINGSMEKRDQTGSLSQVRNGKITAALATADEWFPLEIIAIGNHLTTKVNGQLTADTVDRDNFYQRGHIALQKYDDKTEIRVRKIEIRVLPSEK